MKLCTKCGFTKPKTEFSFIASRNNYFSWCRECKRVDGKRHYKKARDRLVPEPVVYRITNNVNGKVYIGVTHRPFEWRKTQHINRSKAKSLLPIHCALRKYGVENFTFAVIERVSEMAMLEEAEKRQIAAHNSMVPFGYNRTEGGGGTCGLKHSEETIRQHIARHTGFRHTAEARAKISAAGMGRKMPRSAVEAARLKRLGKVRTPEERANISAGRIAGKRAQRVRTSKNSKYSPEVIVTAIARVRAGERQWYVAREIGMTPSYLSQLLAGKRGQTLNGAT